MTSSLSQMVFTSKGIGPRARTLGGHYVDERSLAAGVTHDVAPRGTRPRPKHTASHFCSAWTPELEDRQNHGHWVKQGSLAMRNRVTPRVRALLESHQLEPLPIEVDSPLPRMLAKLQHITVKLYPISYLRGAR